jgi:hypothetical protein
MPRSAFLEEATELLASNPFVPSQPTKTIHIHFRALETIHTYIHTYVVVTISSAAPRGWDGKGWDAYPNAVWQHLHCCGMAQYREVIRDNGAEEKTVDP